MFVEGGGAHRAFAGARRRRRVDWTGVARRSIGSDAASSGLVHPRRAHRGCVTPRSGARLRGMLLFLCAVFVLSGAAGLIYESIWARYLGLFVGHSAYAQVLVLVIFLGGMSVGALAAGRRTAALREPLRWYALRRARGGAARPRLPRRLRLDDAPGLRLDLSCARAGNRAFARQVDDRRAPDPAAVDPARSDVPADERGRRASRSRTRAGTRCRCSTSRTASAPRPACSWRASCSSDSSGCRGRCSSPRWSTLVVALVVLVVHAQPQRSDEAAPSHETSSPELPESTAFVPPLALAARLLLAVSFGTAVASFIYEIAWIRMLSLVLGSATHSFELMLSAFILGLALGAFWIRRRADAGADPVRTLGARAVAMGALAVATLPVYLAVVRLDGATHGRRSRERRRATRRSASRATSICLAVMLPATFCAGMTLPLITRLLLRGGSGRARDRAGVRREHARLDRRRGARRLVLMPLLGLKWLLVVGAAIDIALGVAAAGVAGVERARGAPPRRVLAAVRRRRGACSSSIGSSRRASTRSRADERRVSLRHGRSAGHAARSRSTATAAPRR